MYIKYIYICIYMYKYTHTYIYILSRFKIGVIMDTGIQVRYINGTIGTVVRYDGTMVRYIYGPMVRW